MRKRPKKLTLNRETLRRLEGAPLRHVAGGATHELNTTCACTQGCGGGGTGGGGGGTATTTCTREFVTTCVC